MLLKKYSETAQHMSFESNSASAMTQRFFWKKHLELGRIDVRYFLSKQSLNNAKQVRAETFRFLPKITKLI